MISDDVSNGTVIHAVAQLVIINDDILNVHCLIQFDTIFKTKQLFNVCDDLTDLFTLGTTVEYFYSHTVKDGVRVVSHVEILKKSPSSAKIDQAYVESVTFQKNIEEFRIFQITTAENKRLICGSVSLVKSTMYYSIKIGYPLRIKTILENGLKKVISVRSYASEKEEVKYIGEVKSIFFENKTKFIQVSTNVGNLLIDLNRFDKFDLNSMFHVDKQVTNQSILMGRKLKLNVVPNFHGVASKYLVVGDVLFDDVKVNLATEFTQNEKLKGELIWQFVKHDAVLTKKDITVEYLLVMYKGFLSCVKLVEIIENMSSIFVLIKTDAKKQDLAERDWIVRLTDVASDFVSLWMMLTVKVHCIASGSFVPMKKPEITHTAAVTNQKKDEKSSDPQEIDPHSAREMLEFFNRILKEENPITLYQILRRFDELSPKTLRVVKRTTKALTEIINYHNGLFTIIKIDGKEMLKTRIPVPNTEFPAGSNLNRTPAVKLITKSVQTPAMKLITKSVQTPEVKLITQSVQTNWIWIHEPQNFISDVHAAESDTVSISSSDHVRFESPVTLMPSRDAQLRECIESLKDLLILDLGFHSLIVSRYPDIINRIVALRKFRH